MNLPIIVYTLGKVLACEGALMVLPLVTALIYGEKSSFFAILATIGICLLLGIASLIKKPENDSFRIREGFVATALSWIFISIIGALPFIFTGVINDPISALFETVSGFTTTGASILTDVEVLPKSLLIWRSFTNWIGGMGVLVFVLMIKSGEGGSGANLMKAESPGPQVEKLVPKLQSTAKILYGIYIFLTLLEMVILYISGMPLFDAVNTAIATAGTGGFAVKNASMGAYAPHIQWIVAVFMILFGVNFSFYFLMLSKKFRKAFFIREVWCYFGIILVAVILIMINLGGSLGGFGDALRHTVFQVGTVITTTGFATSDFNMWPQASRTILVILMFVGACAGSTGGGIKVSRIMILCKTVAKEIKTFLHPRSVSKVTIGDKPVAHEVVRSVNVFMATYVLIFVASILLIAFDSHDLVTNFTAVTATINNIGPGLELVGPTGNYAAFSGWSKIVLIFDMLVGRLEIFPIMLLFSRDTWRKF